MKSLKKIEASEVRLRNFIMQAPAMLALLKEPEHRFELINPLFKQFLGNREVIGKTLLEAIPEIKKQGFIELLDKVYKSGETFTGNEMPVMVDRGNGLQQFYLNLTYQAFKNDEGKIEGILVFAYDVTEQVVATQQIEASEKRLSDERMVLYNSFMNAPAGISILKSDTHIYEFANAEYEKLVDRKITPGKTVKELFPEIEQQGLINILDQVFLTGEPFIANEFPVELIDKTTGKLVLRYYNSVIQPIKDEKGNIERLLSHGVEVTQQVEARKQIEASEKRFGAAVEAVQGILWTNNAKGEMEGEQKGWAALTGQSYDEYQGYGWATAVHPDDAQPTIEAWNEAVKEFKPFVFEHRVKTKSGEWELFSIKAIPLLNEDGSIREWIGVHTNITKQKEAAEKIKASEERYRSLFESMDQGFCIIEMIFDNNNNPVDYLFIEANPVFEKHSGIANPVGKTIRAFFPNLEEPWFKIYGKVALTGEANHFIDYIEELNRWFEVSAFRLGDTGSKKVAVLFTNINERKQNEETLRYSKALLEAHNEANRDGLLLVDAKGKIISYNQSFIDVWRMPKEIVETKDDELALEFAMSQLVNPQQFIDKVKWLYEHPSETSMDELEYLDGRIVERYGYSVLGEDGTYYAWSWTFRDITEQKAAAAAIIESENQFRTFADSIQSLAWIANANGWIYWYNQRWYDYTGTTFEEMEGWGWEKVHHPDHVERVVSFVKEAWKKDEAFELTFPLRRHDGEYRWFLTQAYPVKDTNGNIERWIGTNTDIHEQKIINEKKDEFISIASHEMRTPLTIAKGYIDLLLMKLGKGDETIALFASKANEGLKRLQDLVMELLDVSKLQNGKLQYNISTFDFNKLIDETIENIQLGTKDHLIQKSGNSLQPVTADRNRLQQVLINLLTNAIKYSPSANEVLVNVEEKEDMLQVAIKDFGIGMSNQHLDKIFQRYYRVQEHAGHFQGLGIGLYISSEIIQDHKGAMWVESEPAKGSTFYFTLPL